MKVFLAMLMVLTLQGCAQYWELVRIGQSEQWQQQERQFRLQRLERQLERDLRELRKQR